MKTVKHYGDSRDIVLRTHIELNRSYLKLRAKETSWLETQGLTLQQFAILEALYHLGELSVGELTRLILSTPGNMTVVIKNLIGKNLVETIQNDKDRRSKLLCITEKGSEIISAIFPEHVGNLVQWYSESLNEDELQMLSILLRKLEKSQ